MRSGPDRAGRVAMPAGAKTAARIALAAAYSVLFGSASACPMLSAASSVLAGLWALHHAAATAGLASRVPTTGFAAVPA